jgi:hypothetical protein
VMCFALTPAIFFAHESRVWLHSFDHSPIGATHQARLGHEAGC